MKTIIIASKSESFSLIKEAISRCPWDVDWVVSGGSDFGMHARKYATDNSLDYTEFESNTNLYGAAANDIRNGQMAKESDAIIVVADLADSSNYEIKKLVNECKRLGLKIASFVPKELKKNPIKQNPIFEQHFANNDVSSGKNIDTTTIKIGKYSLDVFREQKRNSLPIQFLIALHEKVNALEAKLEKK